MSDDGESTATRVWSSGDFGYWPIATDDALTANRRFGGMAAMDGFSPRNDRYRMTVQQG